MSVDMVIEKFGGVCALARALDIWPSVVMGWKKRGRIPTWRYYSILDKAKELNLSLGLEDFERKESEKHDC